MIDPIELNNEIFAIFFFVLKYALVIILIAIGLITIKKYRGFFRMYKFKEYKMDDEEEKSFKETIKEANVILGIFYVALAMGILIGWLPKLIMILSELFPVLIQRGVFFYVFEWIGNGLLDLFNISIQDFEGIIYYILAGFSFWGFLSMILGLRFIIAYGNKTHTTSFKLLISGIINCIFTGFFTFIPFFI